MKVSRWEASSILCAVLLMVSLYGCYSFISMPPIRSKNNSDLSYMQSAKYVYAAHVKPSLLYDNRTEVSEGEPLYLKLVDRLEITLTYTLTQTPKTVEMADIRLSYETSGTLSGGDWAKNYTLKPKVTTNAYFSDTYTLNIREIQGIVEAIGKETGTGIYTYTYEIKPRISLEASAGGNLIVQEFTPTLTLKFESGKIVLDGLKNTNTGTVSHTEIEPAIFSFMFITSPVATMRDLFIITPIVLSFILIISLRLTLKQRASRSFMQKINDDIREKIIEAVEPPKRIEKATIKVASINDLLKVSEETFKPIIHHERLFYVLDGNIRYEFSLEEPSEYKKGSKQDMAQIKKPRYRRLQCPYVDDKGNKCRVSAFGITEDDAHKKLEKHIEKLHPDKLEEYLKKYKNN